jgi:hypothetical protein
MIRALAMTVLVLALGTAQVGSAQQFAAGFGDLYLTRDIELDPFGDPPGWASCLANPGLPPFSTVRFYLVFRLDFADIGHPEMNQINGFRGWEAKVVVPAALTIVSRSLRPPAPLSIEVGDGPDNWIVGIGTPVLAPETPYASVEYEAMLLSPAQNVRVSLGGSVPSSFQAAAGPGPVPGWLEAFPSGDCIGGDGPRPCLRPFGRWDACPSSLVLNFAGPGGCESRCYVGTNTTTWSAVKNRF